MYGALLLVSEMFLSAYPMLIKLVDASVFFQTGLRMFLFSALAMVAAKATGAPLAAATLFSTESIATGIMNLLHVLASYTAFDALAAGNAMALFYTYPIWNIVGSMIVFGEKLDLKSLPWIGLALAGAVALAKPTTTSWTAIGVAAALVAALTETGIYLWFRARTDAADTKNGDNQPWTKMIQMYGSSAVLWLGFAVLLTIVGGLAAGTWRMSGRGLGGIVAFNSLIGFVGYALRFYIIPKVSTITFSALSFFGVLSAYLLGWVFLGETPTILQGLGAAAIITANTVLMRKDNA